MPVCSGNVRGYQLFFMYYARKRHWYFTALFISLYCLVSFVLSFHTFLSVDFFQNFHQHFTY